MSNVQNTYYRVSIKALILDESKKKFLIGRSDNGKWLLLGGGLEWCESVEDCLARELTEEAGLKIVTFNPNPAYIIPGQRDDGNWAIDLIHEVIVENTNIIPSKECVEVKFASAREVQESKTYKALQRFAQVFDSTIHRRIKKSKDSKC